MGPPGGHFYFQAVRHCMRWASARGATRLIFSWKVHSWIQQIHNDMPENGWYLGPTTILQCIGSGSSLLTWLGPTQPLLVVVATYYSSLSLHWVRLAQLSHSLFDYFSTLLVRPENKRGFVLVAFFVDSYAGKLQPIETKTVLRFNQ